MRTSLLVIPAIVALSLSAPHPQVIVTGTTTGVAPVETFTFIIPCYDGEVDCVPRTVVIDGRDEQRHHPTTTARETVTLTATTRTISTPLTVPIGVRQVLGSPSRSVWWPTTTETVTVTITVYPAPPDTTTLYTSASDGTTRLTTATLSVPIEKRQSLGEITRTVLVSTTIISTSDIYITQTVIHTTTIVQSSTKYSTKYSNFTKTLTSTEFDVSITTDLEKATITTCTESGDLTTTRTPAATLTVPVDLDKRQGFGALPTRSVFTYDGVDKRQGFGALPTRSVYTYDGVVR